MKPRLDSLTALRGLAALLIVVYHAAFAFDASDLVRSRAVSFQVAVTFFFVLSGFVLTWGWQASTPGSFWASRTARLAPAYLVAWFAAIGALSALGRPPGTREMVTTMLGVQAWLPDPALAMSVNPPGWSLSCEVAFYLALPFVAPRILRSGSRGLHVTAQLTVFWCVAATALASLLPIDRWPLYHGCFFLSGVVLAAYLREGWLPGRVARLVGLTSALTSIGLVAAGVSLPGVWLNAIVLPAVVLLLTHCTARDLAGATTVLHHRALQAVGRWSYSLYLTHWVVMALVPQFLPGGAWLPPTVIACVGVAALCHAAVERPGRIMLTSVGRRAVGSRPYRSLELSNADGS